MDRCPIARTEARKAAVAAVIVVAVAFALVYLLAETVWRFLLAPP